jgi:rhodanese-related sulfurtransferase
MLQLSEFLTHHALLAAALLFVLIVMVFNELLIIRRGGKRIAPSDAVRLINDQDALIVDLRAPADFKRGHILAALNVPMAKLDEQISSLNKHQNKPLLLCCALGSVAATAGIKLRKAGFTEVHPMAGGINAWQNAGLPLTSK